MAMRRILTALQVKLIFWLLILLGCVVSVTIFSRRNERRPENKPIDVTDITTEEVQSGAQFSKHLIEHAAEQRNITADAREKAQHFVEEGSAAVLFGDLTAAKESFNKAIQSDPAFADAYYNLACVYAGEKQFPQALENLRKAISLDRKYVQTARDAADFEQLRTTAEFQVLIGR